MSVSTNDPFATAYVFVLSCKKKAIADNRPPYIAHIRPTEVAAALFAREASVGSLVIRIMAWLFIPIMTPINPKGIPRTIRILLKDSPFVYEIQQKKQSGRTIT